MAEQVFLNLTPDPKVLIALTHTDIKPLDALCELIDNAIDSFSSAKLQGVSIPSPTVRIELPKLSEIDSDKGVVRVSDNGPGLKVRPNVKAMKEIKRFCDENGIEYGPIETEWLYPSKEDGKGENQ